ncbi:MAG: M10 family metallopeptidase C-terminal domain-containing protein [Pseudomonadota bacterium]
MPELVGTKWGDGPLGTSGGVVTWSIASGGLNIEPFGVPGKVSVDPESFLTVDFETIIRDAFADWAAVADIEFLQVEGVDEAAGSNRAFIPEIRIFFGEIGPSFDGFAFFPPPNGGALAGDILFDNIDRYNTDTGYFSGLVTHEIGHALGLDHVDIRAIMNADIVVEELQADDIDGIQQIYGVKSGGTPVYDLPVGERGIQILDAPENLLVNGNADANEITGSSAAETLNGGGGRDKLTGGGGGDVFDGGSGDDILIGDEGADIFDGGEGFDTVSYDGAEDRVRADLQGIVEGRGEAAGDIFKAVEILIGSDHRDDLRGDFGENTVFGGEASDRLYGRAGADVIEGDFGDDSLYGNAGQDLMVGGPGADAFIYFRLTDSRVGFGRRDLITDFESGTDKIDLSRVDADLDEDGRQGFEFIGLAQFSGTAGEVRYFRADQSRFVILQIDGDGDGAQDFQIEMSGQFDLEAEDVIL